MSYQVLEITIFKFLWVTCILTVFISFFYSLFLIDFYNSFTSPCLLPRNFLSSVYFFISIPKFSYVYWIYCLAYKTYCLSDIFISAFAWITSFRIAFKIAMSLFVCCFFFYNLVSLLTTNCISRMRRWKGTGSRTIGDSNLVYLLTSKYLWGCYECTPPPQLNSRTHI